MKVVLDTNVIIASFATRGLCHAVFELCLDRFEIVISSFLIEEVETNLLKKLRLPHPLVREITELLSENVCEDPDDAVYLITGDKELLAIKKFGSSKILSPRQFWEAVKQKNEL